jgi:hypothetical protein
MSNFCPFPLHLLSDNIDGVDGGKLYSYRAGTTTPKATYQDTACTVENANPYVFNSAGRGVTGGNLANIWLKSDEAYDIEFTDENDVTIAKIEGYSVIGGSSASQLVCCVDTIADLRALTPGAWGAVIVRGYWTSGDGGGGIFYWDSASTDSDDIGYTIIPDSTPIAGRWKRTRGKTISIAEFGAKDDGADCYDSFVAATAKAVYYKTPLVIPNASKVWSGGYILTGTHAPVNMSNIPIYLFGTLTVATGNSLVNVRISQVGNGAQINGEGMLSTAKLECSPILQVFGNSLTFYNFQSEIDVRWFGNNIDLAFAALPSNGGTIHLPESAIPYTAPVTLDSGDAKPVRIKGGGKAYKDDGNTFVWGTVITGPMIIDKDYCEISDLAVCSGTGVYEALKIANLEESDSVAPRKGIVVRNVSTVCDTGSSTGKSCVIENVTGAIIETLMVRGGCEGLVVSAIQSIVKGVNAGIHTDGGVVFRNLKYARCADIVASDVVIDGTGASPASGYGIVFDNSSAIVETDLSGISVVGYVANNLACPVNLVGNSGSETISNLSITGQRFTDCDDMSMSGTWDKQSVNISEGQIGCDVVVGISGYVPFPVIDGSMKILDNMEVTGNSQMSGTAEVNGKFTANGVFALTGICRGTVQLSSGLAVVAGSWPTTAIVFVSHKTPQLGVTPGILNAYIHTNGDLYIQSTVADSSYVNYMIVETA